MNGSFLPRRRFLLSAGAGATDLMLRLQCLYGAETKLPELSFLVISDTHLGYRDQEHAARQWDRTAAELASAPGELVLHLGDLVDRGREVQYPLYLKTRETIGKSVHEIPGNHDPPDLFAKHIRRQVDTTVDHQWLRFLLLNNCRTESHDGFLSDEQLDWVDWQCRKAAQDRKYVAICMHVPAHTNRHPDRGWYVKPGQGQTELYTIIMRHRDRVLCLMHGHFHNGIRGWEDHAPVHEVVFPSALYNQDRRLAEQDAPGYSLSEFRPGYTLVTIRERVMTLSYRPVGVNAQRNHECRLEQLPRGSL